MKHPTLLKCMLVLCLICLSGAGGLKAEEPSSHDVKAALIYNFLKFIELPSLQKSDEIMICSFAPDRAEDHLASIKGKDVSGRVIRTAALSHPVALKKCHVVYFSESESAVISGMLDSMAEGVLVVGEETRFCKTGGTICFFIEDQKVRFEINTEAAAKTGVIISSKLLRIAGALTKPTAVPVASRED